MLADDPLPGGLLPPGFRLAVVHDEVGMSEPAGRAEIQQFAVKPAIERKRRVAQRAERDSDGCPSHDVVHDLMPDEDLERIGLGHAPCRHDHHR